MAWKAEESQRKQRLDEGEQEDEAEKKWRETEKMKGKKRKVDEEDELDEGSIKRKREVSNKFSNTLNILMNA